MERKTCPDLIVDAVYERKVDYKSSPEALWEICEGATDLDAYRNPQAIATLRDEALRNYHRGDTYFLRCATDLLYHQVSVAEDDEVLISSLANSVQQMDRLCHLMMVAMARHCRYMGGVWDGRVDPVLGKFITDHILD